MDGNTADTIPTNLRLLLVLEEIAKAGVPVPPTDVNKELGLPKPTIHRLFATLEAEGFIQREIDGRAYSPGRRTRALSAGILSSLRIRTARVAILAQLADAIGETCNIALPDRDEMVYLDRFETKWPLRIQLPVGTRVPFHCTASGKLYLSSLKRQHLRSYLKTARLNRFTERTMTDPDVLLDHIDQVRARGYATDNEEFMDGMVAAGVPILGPSGRLVSTLSFHAPTQRLGLDQAIQHLPMVQEAARKLGDILADDA